MFFEGGGQEYKRTDDVLMMKCADDDKSLSVKTYLFAKYCLENYDFDYIFKCDDDSYVHLPRLAIYRPKGDYVGHDMGGFASGGAGYFLSKRAVQMIVEGMQDCPPQRAEDVAVGKTLHKYGVKITHDARFRPYNPDRDVPHPDNDIITGHYFWYPEQHRAVRARFNQRSAAKEGRLPSFTLQINKKKITWIFGYQHDYSVAHKAILPWAYPNCEQISPGGEQFTIGVYLNNPDLPEFFRRASGTKFLVSGECENRYEQWEDAYTFVQNPQPWDNPKYIRYAPGLHCWAPPLERPTKSKKCSAIDGGKYQWRLDQINAAATIIGDVELFGKAFNKPLPGYHSDVIDSKFGNDKWIGLSNFAFHLSIERRCAQDYMTEKFTDAIMCECVPVYCGCTNIDDYCAPDSYLRWQDIEKVDWKNWQGEYDKRRPQILAQKEIVRTRLNVISFFDYLTDHMNFMDRYRPITRCNL